MTTQALPTIEELQNIAKEIRRELLKMLHKSGSGHSGGSLSSADILACLYYHEMKVKPEDPKWEGRDRFILSKGHAAPVLYTTLGLKGYFNKEEQFKQLRKIGSLLRGHPISSVTPGVEVCTGSLGQGLSQANGIALSLKLDKLDARVYAVLGDGECQEGMIWEAAMSSAHWNLDNLCIFVDKNELQIDGKVKDIKNIDPLGKKFDAFGWYTIEIDGHSIEAILNALKEARTVKGKPTCIIAHTVKGKGVSFMEGKHTWHGATPNDEQLAIALEELA